MAAKANKKVVAASVDLPECPVCMDTMSAPIFQCQSGHSLCNTCTNALCPPICPICRQAMTQMRNWQLEDIIMKAKVPCPNKSLGCVYTMNSMDTEDHLKECIFRSIECPMGTVFGKCSWSGQIKEMMDHFKERHPNNCNISSDTDVELDNILINEDDRHFYLVTQGKLLFMINMKIDTIQNMAYWTVQLIGSKKVARQHIYEIHVTSKMDDRRKVVFIEHCFNDAVKAEEVIRHSKCAIIPLNLLSHFIKDKKMSFRFFIKRIPGGPKKHDNDKNNKQPFQGSKGPGPHGPGPNGPGPKGPGPKGPGPKAAGPKGPGPKGQAPGPKGPKPNKERVMNYNNY